MSRLQAIATAAVALSALSLGACGSSDSAGTSDEATSATPSSSSPSTTTDAPATTPAPTTTTAEPDEAPKSDLITYEDGDGDGIYLTTAADTEKLKGAPSDFKAFIAGELNRGAVGDEGCTEPPSIYVSNLDTGGWARGGYSVPNCGGYGALWAKTGGLWNQVWSGQSLVECKTLDAYKIPSRVAGDQCLQGDDAVPYLR